MKRFVLLVSIVISALVAHGQLDAAVYYVSSKKGNDKANGRSPGSPFKTLTRACSQLGANDTLMVFRGSVFRESGVSIGGGTVEAFGPTQYPLPVLAGSLAVTNWKADDSRKGVYVASVNEKVNHVYCNGELLFLARFPNTGWLRTDTGNSGTRINASELAKHPRNKNGYWNGANVRWRRWSWWFETRTVQSWDGSKAMRLAGQAIGPNHDGDHSGFYMDNKIEELDHPGEWFYDASAKKLYVYPPKGVDIENALIEAAVHESGINISNATIKNIEVRHFFKHAISINRPSTIDGCVLRGNRSVAVRGGWESNGSIVKNCTFQDNLNVGITWNENKANVSKTEFHHNTFNNTGMVDGYGGSGVWHASAVIITNANGVRMHHNRINKTGYCGVILGSPNQIVEYNVFRECMSTLNDGGAIYTNCDASIIRHNIVLDTIGENVRSSHKWACLGQGIWPEFLAEFKDTKIINNTVVNSGCHGIFLFNNFDCEITGNVLFGNKDGLLLKGKQGKGAQNNKINDNVFVCTSSEQTPIVFHSGHNYGSMSGNMFAQPYGNFIASNGDNWGRNNLNLEDWLKLPWSDKAPKTFIGKVSPGSKSAIGRPHCFINDTEKAATFELSGTWYTIDKQSFKDTLTLEPYTSKALILGKGRPGNLKGDYSLISDLDAAKTAVLAKEAAAEKDTKKKKTRTKKTKTKKPAVSISDEAFKEWDKRLEQELKKQVAGSKKPYFAFMGKQYRVDELQGTTIKISAGAQKMSYPFNRLKVKDRAALATGLAERGGDEAHALAAFYHNANGDAKNASTHAAKLSKDYRQQLEPFGL